MTVHHNGVRWRKSSRSTATDTCVELAHTRDCIQDSKNPAGPALSASVGDLLAAVKAGHLGQ